MKRIFLLLFAVSIITMSCKSNMLEPVSGGKLIFTISLPEETHIYYEIVNRYNTIVKSEDLGILSPGYYEQVWSNIDNEGNVVNEGIYYLYIFADEEPFVSGTSFTVFN